ncbi:MAG: serine protease [Blastopirellula sp.]|nr:MAG: serine protease [Blastopirellula sp.]
MKNDRIAFNSKAWSLLVAVGVCFSASSIAQAQSVCLPSPRLMTTMPMGGQVGTTVEIKIAGEHFQDLDGLSFSHSGITATKKLDDKGEVVPNVYVVAIAGDCPLGIYEARVMTRLGVSSSRAFNVGSLPETTRATTNTTLETAVPLAVNSLCNAVMTKQAIDYYTFEAKKDQRIVVDCAAKGIDSKLNAVLVIADEQGNDLLVERRGGALDFTAPADGKYVIKVHELTYSGGNYYFYRLALTEAAPGQTVPRLPSTHSVSSFSWPPVGLSNDAASKEVEPNSKQPEAQKITLPCDIAGSFFPAADVDVFEFTAKKGETWWIEVASERLGLPTDPSIVVQQIKGEGADETRTDLVELTDIASPVKVSSNGYSYDGPPYNAGSTDILGKMEIKEDGKYRLQLTDLFGGTRNNPKNVYRLIVRKAKPDFALVGWALHFTLRNGDRNALSKPIALRGGATMPIEVVVIRRDGFNEEINLEMSNLPSGVTAAGLKIPAGKSRGIMLVTADQDAPRGLSSAVFVGKSSINGKPVTRPVEFASMAWPVPNAWSEIPSPRLMADLPVSVGESEKAPVSIASSEDKVWEVTAGQKLTIPLTTILHSDFSGNKISLKTFGAGFDKNPAFDLALDSDKSEVTLDLSKLKTVPGEYQIAFYGSAVAKFQYNPKAVAAAEIALKQTEEMESALEKEALALAKLAKSASKDNQPTANKLAQTATTKHKAMAAKVVANDKKLKTATATAKPKDIVDIVVSKPIRIRVLATEEIVKK